MINNLPKSPRSPSVRLPGIPACRPLLPQQYPLGNVVTRATQAFSPGNSYSGNSCNSSNICSTSNNCRLLTSQLSPPVSPVFPQQSQFSNQLTGPASGKSPVLQPGSGFLRRCPRTSPQPSSSSSPQWFSSRSPSGRAYRLRLCRSRNGQLFRFPLRHRGAAGPNCSVAIIAPLQLGEFQEDDFLLVFIFLHEQFPKCYNPFFT